MFSLNFMRCALLALAMSVAGALTASAQEVGVNPTANAVSEEALFQELDRVTGRVSIPNATAGTLEQPQGREWREVHEQTIPTYGAYIILGMLAVLVLFYLLRGRIRLQSGWSGIRVLRFNSFERFVHWFTAVCFVILGLTGLNIVFGKELLMPLIGAEAFATLTQWGKYAHNYLGIPFAIGILLMLLLWVWDNFPSRTDLAWLASGGGFFGGSGHAPAKRFNFGQKLIFWSVILIGGAISISGFILLFPFQGTTIADMQLAQLVHSLGGIVLIAIILAHIYVGTIGMEGAFEAMGSGTVDRNWAREHHSLWADKAPVVEEQTQGSPGGMPAPAE